MNIYEYKGLTIEVSDDAMYQVDSADNKFKYSKHYFNDGAQDYPVSKHSIKIFKDDELLNDCIVIGSGGTTGIHAESSLINDDEILLCCCDTIICLSLLDLEVKWSTKSDEATCFGIYNLNEHYIVHGEIAISKLDKSGNKIWQFGGSDIFVSFDDDAFKLNIDNIELKDFYGVKYKIDFDGNVIWSSNKS
jgi:hypothetical protein